MNETYDIVLNYYKRVWNDHNVEAILDMVTGEYKRHISPVLPPLNVQGQIDRIKKIQQAFPDMVQIPIDIVVSGNRIFVRLESHCTHRGEFMNIEASGKTIHNSALEEFLIEDGKISQQWGGPDVIDIKRQIEE